MHILYSVQVFDMCWLDDEFLVSGSRDTRLALWRITDDVLESKNEVPTHKSISPISLRECRNAQKVSQFNIFSSVIFFLFLTLDSSFGFQQILRGNRGIEFKRLHSHLERGNV